MILVYSFKVYYTVLSVLFLEVISKGGILLNFVTNFSFYDKFFLFKGVFESKGGVLRAYS